MTIMINSRAAVCATLVASAAAPLPAAAALSAAAPGTPPAEAMRPAVLTGAPIVEAVKTGDRETAIALLREGADPNRAAPDGATALHWAAYRDDADTVDRLLGAGADPRAKNRYGVTPLALAAAGGYGAVVERLLDAGADPDAAASGGETALMSAARAGGVQAVKALLARGADPNAAEATRGQTALMWAAGEGHGEVVRLLLAAGADLNYWDSLDRGRLNVGQPSNKLLAILTGVPDNEVKRVCTVETSIDALVVWVTTKVPEVKGELLVSKGEQISSTVFPFHNLRQWEWKEKYLPYHSSPCISYTVYIAGNI